MNGGHVEEIKSRLSIDEVIGGYVTLEHAGKYLRARCPFHNEKSASFYVSPDRGTYYCFGCNEKGDIFSFVERYEGLDFKGALQLLANRAGVTLAPISKESQSRNDALYSCLETATEFFEKNLLENKFAKDYLQKRSLTDETIKKFRIGYSVNKFSDLTDYLKGNGFTDEIIIATGLGIKSEKDQGVYDRFRGRIMFPVTDTSDRVIAYSARILPEFDDGKMGKYVNSPETELYHKSNILYGFSQAKQYIRKYDFSILVEGQFDVILSHQSGFQNTVAVSGTAFSSDTENQSGAPTHLGLLSKLSTNMILALDSDSAGEKAMIRTLHAALPLGILIKLIKNLEDKKDPADILSMPDGIKIWKEILTDAERPIEALSKRIISNNSVRSVQIDEFKKTILPLIAILPAETDKYEAARIIEKYFGIPIDLVLKDVISYESKNKIFMVNKEQDILNSPPQLEIANVKEKFWGLYFAASIEDSVAKKYREILYEWLDKNIPKDERDKDENEFKKDADVLSMKMDIQLGRTNNTDAFVNDLMLEYEEYIFRGILNKVKEELLKNENDPILITRQAEVRKTIEEIKEKRRNI